MEQFSGLERQSERPFEDRELAIDRRILGPLLAAYGDVDADLRGGEARHPLAAEVRREMQAEAVLDVGQRSLAVDPVIVHHVGRGVLNRHPTYPAETGTPFATSPSRISSAGRSPRYFLSLWLDSSCRWPLR